MNKVQKRLIESRVNSKAKVARLNAAGWDFFYDPNRPSALPTAPTVQQTENPSPNSSPSPSPVDRAASKMAGQMVYEITGNWRQRKKARNAMAQSDASKSASGEPTYILGPGVCGKLRPYLGRRPDVAVAMAQAARDPRNSGIASRLDAGGTRPPFFLRDCTDPAASTKERERRHKLNRLADPAFGEQDSKPTRAITTPPSGLDILGRSDNQII